MEAETAVRPLSRRVAVVVSRGLVTKTSQIIWEHEIPLLEEIHGADSVQIVTDKAIKDADAGYKPDPKDPYRYKPSEALGLGDVFNGDADEEYQRLAAVYGMHQKQEMSVVEVVYGRLNGGRFRQLIGRPQLADLSNRQLREYLTRDLELLPHERQPDGSMIARDFDPQAKRADLLKLAARKPVKEAA